MSHVQLGSRRTIDIILRRSEVTTDTAALLGACLGSPSPRPQLLQEKCNGSTASPSPKEVAILRAHFARFHLMCFPPATQSLALVGYIHIHAINKCLAGATQSTYFSEALVLWQKPIKITNKNNTPPLYQTSYLGKVATN